MSETAQTQKLSESEMPLTERKQSVMINPTTSEEQMGLVNKIQGLKENKDSREILKDVAGSEDVTPVNRPISPGRSRFSIPIEWRRRLVRIGAAAGIVSAIYSGEKATAQTLALNRPAGGLLEGVSVAPRTPK